MENLFGNFWFHDDGSGQVSVYERIGRRYLPVRVETEGWPDRLPFEARKLLDERLAERLEVATTRTPTDVKLSNLEAALMAFPGFEAMTSEDKEALKLVLVGNRPELLRPLAPDPLPVPQTRTVEQEVQAMNQVKLEETNKLAEVQTLVLQQQAENERLRQELLNLKLANGQTQEVTQGQDASSSQGLLGQEARQENQENSRGA